MSLFDHPGYLGWTSQYVVAIHADWPMYPEEHGPALALVWLTAFPVGTTFVEVDDIDECVLFLANLPGTDVNKPYEEKNLHVAIWHEDLVRLAADSDVDGVTAITARRREELRRVGIGGPLFVKLEDGTLLEVVEAPLDDYDDEFASRPRIAETGVRVTRTGHDRAAELLQDVDLSPFGEAVRTMFAQGLLDPALRQACVETEDRLRKLLGSRKIGERLAGDMFDQLIAERVLPSSYAKVLRAQFRLVARFIRNEVAHNILELDEVQCRALLFRVARLRVGLEAALAQ